MKNIIHFVLLIFLTACGEVTPVPTMTSPPTRTPTFTPSPTAVILETSTPFVERTFPGGECPTAASDILTEFAGSYEYSNEIAMYSLILNCNGTFDAQMFIDDGQILSKDGNMQVENGQLILTGIDAAGTAFRVIYIPVQWGQRKYLIESERIAAFCQVINRFDEAGGDAQVGSHYPGSYYLRSGDQKLEATGFPVTVDGKALCK